MNEKEISTDNENIDNPLTPKKNIIWFLKFIVIKIFGFIKILFYCVFIIFLIGILTSVENDENNVPENDVIVEAMDKEGNNIDLSSLSNSYKKSKEYYFDFYEHKIQINQYIKEKSSLYEINLLDIDGSVLDSDVFISNELNTTIDTYLYIDESLSVKFSDIKYIIKIIDESTKTNIDLLINDNKIKTISKIIASK